MYKFLVSSKMFLQILLSTVTHSFTGLKYFQLIMLDLTCNMISMQVCSLIISLYTARQMLVPYMEAFLMEFSGRNFAKPIDWTTEKLSGEA